MTEEALVAVREAARRCGVSAALLRRLASEDGIPLVDREGEPALSWRDLRRCLSRRGLPVPGGSSPGPTVLLVDDDADQLLVMAESLAAIWPTARVVTARDGVQALRRLLEEIPDLLVTDIEMPSLTGIELVRWVRQNRELGRTKVLAVTGYHSVSRNRLALEGGADEYITKPFSPIELRQSAVRLLGPDRG